MDSPAGRSPTNAYWYTGEAPLLLNSARRRAYEFFPLDLPPEKGGGSTGIRVFDLDTLQELSYAVVPRAKILTYTFGRAQTVFPSAVEPERGWLFILTVPSRITILDEAALEAGRDPVVAHLPVPQSQASFCGRAGDLNGPCAIKGISLFSDDDGRLKMLVVFAGVGTYLAQWDIPNALAGNDYGDWFHRLVTCNSPGSQDRSQDPIMRSKNGSHVTITCTPKASTTAVVVLDLDAGGLVTGEEAFKGPEKAIAGLVDPEADRLHVVSERVSVGAQESSHDLWTFDASLRRWVGRSGLTLGTVLEDSFGIDQTTGRVYALAPDNKVTGVEEILAPGGLMMIDGRLTPTPQPLLFPEFAYPSVPPIAVDPGDGGRPTRIFVRRGPAVEDNTNAGETARQTSYPSYPDGRNVSLRAEPFWLVIADDVPLAASPVLGDLDRLTVDVPETDRATAVAFEGTGGAYGARARMVRGIQSALTLEASGQPISRSNGVKQFDPACWRDDRVYTFGDASEARWSSHQSTASAVAIRMDPVTRADLESPASRCQTTFVPSKSSFLLRPADDPLRDSLKVGTSQADDLLFDPVDEDGNPKQPGATLKSHWEVAGVACVGGGPASSVRTKDQETSSTSDLSARVDCSGQKPARSEATARALALAGVSVAEAGAVTWAEPDEERGGITVTSEAWARGIAVTGFHVSLVHAKSTAWSNGRVPTDPVRTSWERTICGIGTTAEEAARNKSRCYRDVQDDEGARARQVCTLDIPVSSVDNEDLQGRRESFVEEYDAFCTPGGELDVVAARVSGALPDRLRMRVPTPDPAYAKGSPRGYIAGIQKRAGDQFDDALLNGDASWEVPTLEITLERDEGRQIFQFAAVRALASYGITCLPPRTYDRGEAACVEPSFDFGPAGPSGGGSSGDVFEPTSSPPPAPPDDGEETTPVAGPSVEGRSWRVLSLRSLGEGLLSASVWFALLLPAMLGARRRLALRTMRGDVA